MDAPSGPAMRDAPLQSPFDAASSTAPSTTTTTAPAAFPQSCRPAPRTPEPVQHPLGHHQRPGATDALDQQQHQQYDQQFDHPHYQQPPPPPRMRVKRRRPLVLANLHCQIPSSDCPLPSIELSESSQLGPGMPLDHYARQDHLLSPSSPACLGRVLSPPKTPLGQITASFDDTPCTRSSWSAATGAAAAAATPCVRRGSANSINRPPSAWSELSDSSVSSLGSSDTFPRPGDCTSPDTDDGDPFIFPDAPPPSNPQSKAAATTVLASPMRLTTTTAADRRTQKRTRSETPVDWTLDMDEHLWLTYMKYLCDPTVTPFKTLPGSAPPLGVCHRVAREAKRSFMRGPRAQLAAISEHRRPADFASIDTLVRRESSVPLDAHAAASHALRVEPVRRPHSTTGVKAKTSTRWAASSHQTRKRLRHLCKRKPTLSPHYQRLMQSRSPSPADSSSPHATLRPSHPASSHARRSDDAFSTRDLNFTLSTATASTMQPGNPLAQLSGDAGGLLSGPPPATPERSASRCNPHQKSQSLQLGLGLGLGLGREQPAHDMQRLASPFQESHQQQLAVAATNPAQAGPSSSSLRPDDVDDRLHIYQPRPLSGSMKRRAQYQLGEELLSDDPEQRRSYLEDLFRDNGAGKRRVRSRGFSLGAVGQHQYQQQPSLTELFTPPSASTAASALPTPMLTVTQPAPQLQAPHVTGGVTKRLGSPFAPVQNSWLSNTFPRSIFPQGLDSISSLEQQQQQQQQQQSQQQQVQHQALQPQQQPQPQPQPQQPTSPLPVPASDDSMLDTPKQSDFDFAGQSSPLGRP